MTHTQKPAVRRAGPRRRAPRPSGRFLLAVALSGLLNGCFFSTAQWSEVEAPKNNKVEWISFDHQVAFDEIGARLSGDERRKLMEFLGYIRVTGRDDIILSAPGRKGAVRDEALAARRLAAVKAQIASVGLTTHDAVKTREDKDWDGSVRMVVGRYVVTPPSCPNWTKPSGSDWTNATPSNHGCATTINLGLMLADPGDLVRARPITPSDGQAGASKVDKYRKGQTEKAKVTSTAGGSSQ